MKIIRRTIFVLVLFLLIFGGGFFALEKIFKKDYEYIFIIPENVPKPVEEISLSETRREELNKQIEDLEKKISEDAKNLDNYWGLAIAKKSLGDLRGAAEVYVRAIRAVPDYYFGYSNLGTLYALMEDYGRAEMAYQEALVRAKTRDFVYKDLAELYEYQIKDKAKAIAMYEKGIEILPYNNLELIKSLAGLYERDDNLEKALEFWKLAKRVAVGEHPEIDAKIAELEKKVTSTQ